MPPSSIKSGEETSMQEVRVAWNPLGCIKKWEADSH
jgi:hypothetical protein